MSLPEMPLNISAFQMSHADIQEHTSTHEYLQIPMIICSWLVLWLLHCALS